MDIKELEKNKLLEEQDDEQNYLKYINFYSDMSKIENLDYFYQVIESLKKEDKIEFENGIIHIFNKNIKQEFEKIFLDKYDKYLCKKINSDIKEYYNNKYCFELLARYYDINPQIAFINGQKLSDIDILITDEYKKLMNDIEKNIELSNESHEFLKSAFLFCIFYGCIYKEYDNKREMMYDIVTYFERYPLSNDMNNFQNIQFYLLYLLSKELLSIPKNCAIQFSKNPIVENNFYARGGIGKTENGALLIEVNDVNKYNINNSKKLMSVLLTIFHEIGHLHQELGLEDYNEEVQEQFRIEKFIQDNDRDFYLKYHDNFLIEKDANNHGIIRLLQYFGNTAPEAVNSIIDDRKQEEYNLMDEEEFKILLMERYEYVRLNKKAI